MNLEDPWIDHLLELRRRFLYCLITVIIIAIPLFYFARDLYHIFALPLLNNLPPQGQIIATTVTAPLIVPIKLALYIALIISVPILLYHAWVFIAPALYRHERYWLWPVLLSSSVLFYCGMLFAYTLILPLLFHFLTHVAPMGVVVMTDMNAYVNFTLKLALAFGLAFEIPIVIFLLARMQVCTYQQLSATRRYVIVMAFVIGMLIAPDVISQTFLALPIWGLYELGMLAVYITKRQ